MPRQSVSTKAPIRRCRIGASCNNLARRANSDNSSPLAILQPYRGAIAIAVFVACRAPSRCKVVEQCDQRLGFDETGRVRIPDFLDWTEAMTHGLVHPFSGSLCRKRAVGRTACGDHYARMFNCCASVPGTRTRGMLEQNVQRALMDAGSRGAGRSPKTQSDGR
jgi:hypothetical protein